MPQITLSRADAVKLFEFCADHDLKQWFVAKDQGAYVGASAGEKGNCIFYFKGCDPTKDADWWDNCSAKFGGDDFGDELDLAWLQKIADDTDITSMRVKVSPTRVAAEYFKRKST